MFSLSNPVQKVCKVIGRMLGFSGRSVPPALHNNRAMTHLLTFLLLNKNYNGVDFKETNIIWKMHLFWKIRDFMKKTENLPFFFFLKNGQSADIFCRKYVNLNYFCLIKLSVFLQTVVSDIKVQETRDSKNTFFQLKG